MCHLFSWNCNWVFIPIVMTPVFDPGHINAEFFSYKKGQEETQSHFQKEVARSDHVYTY
jgi:hypothetical protein